MFFTIKVKYTTGNSFNSVIEETEIGLCWESIELAQQALNTLDEHYRLYKEYNNHTHIQSLVTKKAIEKRVRKFDWFHKSINQLSNPNEIRSGDWVWHCAVLMDDGQYRNLPTSMWCGYFESLHSAELAIKSTTESNSGYKYYH